MARAAVRYRHKATPYVAGDHKSNYLKVAEFLVRQHLSVSVAEKLEAGEPNIHGLAIR